MILVDSSVWIDRINHVPSVQAQRLIALIDAEPPLLAYERGGRITVLDLARLEAAAEGQEV